MKLIALALLASAVHALPASRFMKRAIGGPEADITIHESCNATNRAQISRAWNESKAFLSNGIEYLAKNGPNDPMYEKYFGNGDFITVMGGLTTLLYGNKEGVLFRCDNPDGNCRQEGWAGHWRGQNATSETVICDYSYESRMPLEQMCSKGYTVAGSNPNIIFANDLVHRLMHIPQTVDDEIIHVEGADDYLPALELSRNNASWAALNSDSYQYFLAEAWSMERANPGVGCLGTPPAETDVHSHGAAASAPDAHSHSHSDDHSHSHSDDHDHSSTPAAGPTPTAAAPVLAPSPTESIGCQPHDDHWHCEGPRTA